MTVHDCADTALYLYCVGKAGEIGAIGAEGVDERFAPFILVCGDLAALASEVPLADFCGPEAERRLENLEWVGERAMRHERMVEQALLHAPMLPARFGTLFSGADALRRFLEINRDPISGFLEATRGHEEWGIRASLDRSAATRWLAAKIAAAANTPVSPGLRYLHQKRAQAAAESELNRWVGDACEAAAESMRELTDDWRVRKIIESAADDGSARPVMNAAALLRRERSPDLLVRIEAINAQHPADGLSFAATGPWPPYSFCPQLRTPQ